MIKITHQQICAYLQNNCKPEELAKIEQLRRKDRALDSFIKMMEVLKLGVEVKAVKHFGQVGKELDFEKVLEHLLAGNIRPNEAQLFFERLLHSPSLAERIYRKFSQIPQFADDEESPDLELVRVKSNEELFKVVKAASTSRGKEAMTAFQQQISYAVTDFWAALTRPESWKPTMRWLPVGSAIVVIALVTGLLKPFGIEPTQRTANSIFVSQVPYPFVKSSFRGSNDHASDNSRLNDFSAKFNGVMSDYLLDNYQETIVDLEKLESMAKPLREQTSDSTAAKILRDYYFYLGQSHLAVVEQNKLKKSKKNYHFNKALASIYQAETIDKAAGLHGTEREDFFLGLVYGLSGQTDSALVHLRKISSQSDFYTDGNTLIDVLSTH
jgi:tetratricopeptide (TPR) repeat protein